MSDVQMEMVHLSCSISLDKVGAVALKGTHDDFLKPE
jgi:hypothetical protein